LRTVENDCKRWLARVGKERLDEIEQPTKAIERAKGYYIAKGYSPEWVQTRTAKNYDKFISEFRTCITYESFTPN
jgi:hypothetical protein